MYTRLLMRAALGACSDNAAVTIGSKGAVEEWQKICQLHEQLRAERKLRQSSLCCMLLQFRGMSQLAALAAPRVIP